MSQIEDISLHGVLVSKDLSADSCEENTLGVSNSSRKVSGLGGGVG